MGLSKIKCRVNGCSAAARGHAGDLIVCGKHRQRWVHHGSFDLVGPHRRIDPTDLAGVRFHRLLVIRQNGQVGIQKRWLCSCDCGKETLVCQSNLKNGTTKSCGCLRVKHGNYKHPLYVIWLGMIARCSNPSHKQWADYGGRGIEVCNRWRSSLLDFASDMGARPSPKHSVDRIDVNGHYEHANCRWATPTQQARNCRTNLVVLVNDQSMSLAEASEQLGVKYATAYGRLRRGAALREEVQNA